MNVLPLNFLIKVVRQYFRGRQHFEYKFPIDPSSMMRWRKRIGSSGREIKKLKTYLGRVVRDIERKTCKPRDKLKELLCLAKRLIEQQRHSKHKIYSIHEPDVVCIAKGKVYQRYEFGSKAGFVVSAKGNWIFGAQSFGGNPYDGHTLKKDLEQAQEFSTVKIKQAICNLGYRGHGLKELKVDIVPRRKRIKPANLYVAGGADAMPLNRLLGITKK